MTTNNKFFIGYTRLEEMLRTHPKEEPLYVTCQTVPPQGGNSNMPTVHSLVLMVQALVKGRVRYCRFPLGYVTFLYNKPFEGEGDYERKIRAAEEAERIVREYLAEEGFETTTAYISEPRNIQVINGHADFLRYDKEKRTYIRSVPGCTANVEPERELAATGTGG